MNGMGRPEQINMFKSFDADLAILPELKQKNIDALCPTDAVWITNNHTNKIPKGLGVLSFNQTRLTELERDEDMEIYFYTPAYVTHLSHPGMLPSPHHLRLSTGLEMTDTEHPLL